jgi:NADPH-dependent 2,4-dienoyl-CoA reductase/sulfur reductase-like enzyme
MKQIDLLIVGGGPAGIAAAASAAQHDISVKLVNEAPALGGQVLNNTGQSEQSSYNGLAIERGKELLRQLHTLPLDVQHQTIVWAIKDRRVALV